MLSRYDRSEEANRLEAEADLHEDEPDELTVEGLAKFRLGRWPLPWQRDARAKRHWHIYASQRHWRMRLAQLHGPVASRVDGWEGEA